MTQGRRGESSHDGSLSRSHLPSTPPPPWACCAYPARSLARLSPARPDAGRHERPHRPPRRDRLGPALELPQPRARFAPSQHLALGLGLALPGAHTPTTLPTATANAAATAAVDELVEVDRERAEGAERLPSEGRAAVIGRRRRSEGELVRLGRAKDDLAAGRRDSTRGGGGGGREGRKAKTSAEMGASSRSARDAQRGFGGRGRERTRFFRSSSSSSSFSSSLSSSAAAAAAEEAEGGGLSPPMSLKPSQRPQLCLSVRSTTLAPAVRWRPAKLTARTPRVGCMICRRSAQNSCRDRV